MGTTMTQPLILLIVLRLLRISIPNSNYFNNNKLSSKNRMIMFNISMVMPSDDNVQYDNERRGSEQSETTGCKIMYSTGKCDPVQRLLDVQ